MKASEQIPGVGTRLGRIDSMEHSIVWEGTRHGNFDTHWLSVDSDGRVLLTGSGQASGTYATVKFESLPYVFHSVFPTALQIGQGYLVSPPVIDDKGYFFAPLDADGKFHPIRVPNLNENHPNGIQLGSCL